MVKRARGLFEDLRRHLVVEYDDSAAIGRRYRRQDEIGTPFAFTIDEQTLADDTVTVRDRDSLAQERIGLARAGEHLRRPSSGPGRRRGGVSPRRGRRSAPRGAGCSRTPRRATLHRAGRATRGTAPSSTSVLFVPSIGRRPRRR